MAEIIRLVEMRSKLEEFREVLAASEPEVLALLRPGLSREQIEERLSRLPFKISPDAIELYAWADGNFEKPVEILPGAYFYGLDDSVAEFEQIASIIEEMDQIFPQRYRDCFRFLSDFSDGGYAFGRLDSPSEGKIIALCIHDEWKLAYQSLEKLVETAIECRRRGILKPDGTTDFYAYFALARELNPGMENWEERSV